jgi:hypothetical protein
MAAEAVPAIQNKVGQFTANALIRNMVGQAKSSFNIREMMDEKKILIINLSKGKIGESNANLLGGMLITKIYLAAMSRADLSNRVMQTMPNFYLFVDEFQSFANESFADILSEARKYKLNLTIAHQYIEQMEEEVRAAVFGNVGTMIVFRVGATDAEYLEKEFAPTFTAEDIVNLGRYQIYLKLMIDGISSSPFSATNLPPIKPPEISHVQEVIAMSRKQFANSRDSVEKEIVDWHAPKPRVQVPAAPAQVPASAPSFQTAPLASKPAAGTFSPPKVFAKPPQISPSSRPQSPAPSSAQRPPSPAPQPFPQRQPTPLAPTPKQEMKQPFREALKTVPLATPTPVQVTAQVVVSAPTPMSLSSLSKTIPKVDAKKPTEKNIGDLKSALAAIMPKEKPKEIQKEFHQEAKKEFPKTPEPLVPATPPIQKDEPKGQEEIPREVLEKVLKVE